MNFGAKSAIRRKLQFKQARLVLRQDSVETLVNRPYLCRAGGIRLSSCQSKLASYPIGAEHGHRGPSDLGWRRTWPAGRPTRRAEWPGSGGSSDFIRLRMAEDVTQGSGSSADRVQDAWGGAATCPSERSDKPADNGGRIPRSSREEELGVEVGSFFVDRYQRSCVAVGTEFRRRGWTARTHRNGPMADTRQKQIARPRTDKEID